MNKVYIHKDTKTDEPVQQELQNYFQVINGTSLYYENYVKQLQQELEEYSKKVNEFTCQFLSQDLIIKKQQQELERYKNIVDEVLESVCCIEHNLDKYEEIGLDHLEYAQNKIAELKEYLIELKGE